MDDWCYTDYGCLGVEGWSGKSRDGIKVMAWSEGKENGEACLGSNRRSLIRCH